MLCFSLFLFLLIVVLWCLLHHRHSSGPERIELQDLGVVCVSGKEGGDEEDVLYDKTSYKRPKKAKSSPPSSPSLVDIDLEAGPSDRPPTRQAAIRARRRLTELKDYGYSIQREE